MKIYSTEDKAKVDFKPMEEGKVGIYLCGPTVYDLAHLGHGRSATAFDVIRRYFIYKGFDVTFVSNYTDIDDKMIKRAKEEGISVKELADKIIPEYEQDYGALGILPSDIAPKATEHTGEMIEIVKRLEEKSLTYVLEDGVYFDVAKFEGYGKLSGQNLEELKMGARVEVNEAKRNPYDFVLWKFKKEGEPSWESPWGEGRPGWHIECSGMSYKHLGETFDIHAGGADLTFPHHECEVAQSQGAFGEETFARYWIHNGFIKVDDEKMSKSLNNFFTLRDVFEKFDPRVVRLMYLQTHYRNPINFSDALLDQAKAALMRLHDFVRKIEGILEEGENGEAASEDLEAAIAEAKKQFEDAMDDDFETSGALGSVFDLVRKGNSILDAEGGHANATALKAILEAFDNVLAVIFVDQEGVDEEILALIDEREKARAAKDFNKSDEIRDQLAEKGIVLEDTAKGTIWKKA